MKKVVFIPARYQSFRLPGKPLIALCGVPMIIRTYRQCLKVAKNENIYILTDDARIKKTCEEYGAQVIMTSDNCLTGTDRVAEAAKQVEADVYINVQGDEPVFNPDDLLKIIAESIKYPDCVINGYCEIEDENLYRSSNIPKVVVSPGGFLIYMSRAGIPANKKKQFLRAWRQVCLYVFPRKSLKKFTKYGRKSPLEKIEDIEILRFIEMNEKVRMVKMSDESISVDTEEDIPSVKKAIKERKL